MNKSFRKVLLMSGAVLFTALPASAEPMQKLEPPFQWGLLEQLVVIVLLLIVVLILQTYEISIELRRTKKRQDAMAGKTAPSVRFTWFDLFTNKKLPEGEHTDEHVYDGIEEKDNAAPSWFNWLFYGTVGIAAVYLMYFHVFGIGKLQLEEYADQMKKGEALMAKAQEKAIELADKPRYTEEAKLALGKKTYADKCAMCHGDQGQGVIGPNLTDEYWLHGGTYKDVFTTIFNGVPDKGMLSWKKSLKPDEIRAVASFVYSLQGTTPPNPKEPQGDKVVMEGGKSAQTGQL